MWRRSFVRRRRKLYARWFFSYEQFLLKNCFFFFLTLRYTIRKHIATNWLDLLNIRFLSPSFWFSVVHFVFSYLRNKTMKYLVKLNCYALDWFTFYFRNSLKESKGREVWYEDVSRWMFYQYLVQKIVTFPRLFELYTFRTPYMVAVFSLWEQKSKNGRNSLNSQPQLEDHECVHDQQKHSA